MAPDFGCSGQPGKLVINGSQLTTVQSKWFSKKSTYPIETALGILNLLFLRYQEVVKYSLIIQGGSSKMQLPASLVMTWKIFILYQNAKL